MKITRKLLWEHGACRGQVREFHRLYPNGCEPTIEVLFDLAAEGLDAWWLQRLLPAEGLGSRREYALWCVEQVEDLLPESVRRNVLPVIRWRVHGPDDVSDEDLAAARDAAGDAARDAAGAAWAAAGGAGAAWAAWAAAGAAWAVAGDAQLVKLSDLLLRAPCSGE